MVRWLVPALLLGMLLVGISFIAPRQEEVGWEAYGRDVQGTRYLPVANITRENVRQLEVAWTYRTGEMDPQYETDKPASFQATPIVVEGTMYLSTPLGRVIALDPESGEELWEFDPDIRRDIRYGDFASRGVSIWLDEAPPASSPPSTPAAKDTGEEVDGLPGRPEGLSSIASLLVGRERATAERVFESVNLRKTLVGYNGEEVSIRLSALWGGCMLGREPEKGRLANVATLL